MTTHVERSIEVEVPVRTAYDQWTQFEEFPRFMSGVQEVRQVGEALTHWVAEIAGVRREWDAAILEQVPDEKVAWAATTGATNAGAVFFQAVGENRTQVRLALDYEPEGIVERIADFFDVIDRQAVADLDRFKEFIERAGSATGGWRGEVEEGDVVGAGTAGAAGVGAAAASGGPVADEVAGNVAAFGPTGDTRSTVTIEPQHPLASGEAGVAGFGTDTGMSSDDPASGALTGDPDTAGGAGFTTSDEPGRGSNQDPVSWTDEPGASSGTTEATTDPVGESWSGDADDPAAEAGETRTDSTRGAAAVDELGPAAEPATPQRSITGMGGARTPTSGSQDV